MSSLLASSSFCAAPKSARQHTSLRGKIWPVACKQARHQHSGSLYLGLPISAQGRCIASSSSSSQEDPGAVHTSPASTPELAWKFLKDFTKSGVRGMATSFVDSPEKRAALRNALVVAYAHPYPAAGWAPSERQAAAALAASTGSPEAKAALKEAKAAATGSAADPSVAPSGAGLADADQEVMFGIMAGSVRIGVRALRDWCQGLGLPYVKPVSRVDGGLSPAAIKGGVYIKYNAKSKLCYVSSYESRDKGVLVQMAQEQLGHFPLGLFDEAMNNPEPEL